MSQDLLNSQYVKKILQNAESGINYDTDYEKKRRVISNCELQYSYGKVKSMPDYFFVIISVTHIFFFQET